MGDEEDTETKKEAREHCIRNSFTICWPFGIKHYRRPNRMRWSGHEACMRERTDAYRFLVGKPAGKDGRIILKWAVKKQDGTGFMSVRIGTGGGLL